MKQNNRHHIEIAMEKFSKKQDITICTIVNSGVIYKGGFYPDCYLENYEGKATACIEVDSFLCLFTPDGVFACAYKIDSGNEKKGYKKTLNRILK
jgi:hypothetical protein